MSGPGPDRLSLARGVIAGLFDAPVGVAVTDPRLRHPAPMAEETAHLARALPKRQREFAAGRAVARRAMRDLGASSAAVRVGSDRAPVWPEGLAGSISHSATLCAAVVGRVPLALGIDVEDEAPLDAPLMGAICSPAELGRIAGPDQGRLAKVVFSAKEAAFKAQYAISGTMFGFETLDVTLDPERRAFSAVFTADVAPFAQGARIDGRFDWVAGHVVSAVTLKGIS